MMIDHKALNQWKFIFRRAVQEWGLETRILTNMIEGDDFPGWRDRLEAQSKLVDLAKRKVIELKGQRPNER